LIARHPKPGAVLASQDESPGRRALWIEVLPLLLPLILGLGFKIDFVYATAVGLLFGFLTQGVSRDVLGKVFSQGVRIQLLLVIGAVMIFKVALESSGLLKTLSQALSGYGIPLVFLALALPLIISTATGMELVAVGMAYPMLVGLVPEGSSALPYILIMMTANAIGQTHSPVHICMVVGNEYFGANLRKVVRMSLVPQVFRLIATFLFAWLLYLYLPR
jgi:hypothetical protein